MKGINLKKSDEKKLLKRAEEDDEALRITVLTNLDLTKRIVIQDTKIEMLIAIINSMSEEHGSQVLVNKSVKKMIENNIKRIDHLENFLDSVQEELLSDDDEDRIIN